MILRVSNYDCAALALHMSIMRKSFKNLLKVRYKNTAKELLQSYDYVLTICRDALDQKLDYTDLHLNITDVDVLHEFLLSYTTKLAPVLDDIQAKDNDKEQLQALCKLCSNLQILKISA